MILNTAAQADGKLSGDDGRVTRAARERAHGHRGVTLWLTGLSGAGKTTLARALEAELFRRGTEIYVLDGDEVRHGLSRDLGFSPEARAENIRRAGEVAKLFTEFGTIVITAFISPYASDRNGVRALLPPGDFVEVFVDAPLETCEARDPKGLYAKARRGEIPQFTGISAPYEPPASPELIVRTAQDTLDACVARVLEYLERHGYLEAESGAERASVTEPRSMAARDPAPVTVRAAESVGNGAAAAATSHDSAGLLAPYGGTLVDRRLSGEAADEARRRARTLPRLEIPGHTLSDLYLIAVGGLSPLSGFMGRTDYESVLERLTLANGLPWSIPITVAVGATLADRLAAGDELALAAPDGRTAAILHVDELFRWDREREAALVYGTTDRAHPGVARLGGLGDVLVGGRIDYVYEHDVSGFPALNLTPAATRAEFERRGWRTIVGFQTRNPVHRAHEYLQKCALESVDGLLLHPLVGDTKADDVPAAVRIASYRALLERYYPADRVLLSVLPAAMRYAGPREAVFHAIVRRNYGCTHFIVGRDHAGVGSYYGSYDAQRIFDTLDLEKLGIVPLKFEHAFYCTDCCQMVSAKTCPHDGASHVVLSGTRVRELLALGERPPAEFTRAEVADVLVRAYAIEQQA